MHVSSNYSHRVSEARATEVGQTPQTPEIGPALRQRFEHVRQLPRLTESFVNEQLTRGADPALKGTKVSYQRIEGELFGASGPKVSHIKQGGLGDCYFLAAVGSVVADDPSAIRNAMRDNGDGTYSVRFYKNNGDAVWIKVDADLPVDANGKLAYAKGVDSDGDGKLELWVPLMEKAYAKFEDKYGPKDGVDGYADIGAGGHARKAIQTLTGKDASNHKIPASDSKLEDLLSPANDGSAVVLNVGTSGGGWVANHAYTVVGTFEVDGEVRVSLRNPWGTREPDAADHGARENDGLFSVSLDELRDHASSIDSNAKSNSGNLLDAILGLFR
jgi:hypothetical protein